MKLTKQAKKEFEKWYWIEYCDNQYYNWFDFEKIASDSMKFGVYVDWFDSVGIYISIIGNNYQSYEVFIDNDFKAFRPIRHEARTKAVELANEIFNKRNAK